MTDTVAATSPNTNSAFADIGLKETVTLLIEEIQELYKADEIPWIVGYSGGKDSTAVLSLVWLAIDRLPIEQDTKKFMSSPPIPWLKIQLLLIGLRIH
jgi:DNA sulfur modification protein DndC